MNFPVVLLRAALALALAALLCAADAARRDVLVPARASIAPLPQLAQAQTGAEAATNLQPDQDAGYWRQTGQGRIPMPPGVLAAHASTLVAMPPSSSASMLAFWFAGDRESAPNVQIAMSALDRASGIWSPARLVVDRWEMAKTLGFGIRRLGNPVAWLDPQGQVHLYVVATGLGGWAAGRILHLHQAKQDSGLAIAWEPLGVLPLSWLWNTSYLVRTAPLALADGGAILPAYFELFRKSAVGVRVNAQGNFIDAERISANGHNLQPALLAIDEVHWLSLMRDHGPEGKIRMAQTSDGGGHWSDAGDLPLDNPDSSVSTLTLGDQHLLVYNPLRAGRHVLRLSTSPDGLRWRMVTELAQGSEDHEYSYPAMVLADGQLWVSYTEQRKFISWQRFAWVRGQPLPAVASQGQR